MVTVDVSRARATAETVADPELPMVTIADLGVLRAVSVVDGRVLVSITPTYTGCPAMDEIRADLRNALRQAGFPDVDVRTVLSPAWTTDWITEAGRRKLIDAGIAPPGPAPKGPVPITIGPARWNVRCPQCGSSDTTEISRFGSTACQALHRCRACGEPFGRFKEL
jgi:ring-1,2-phenylacetyl-CoA epoxidase subunit PaaD